MTIVTGELQTYKSAVVTNDSTNGGPMSNVLVQDNALQNVFPHVFKAERDAGSTLYRKLFDKVQNSSDDVLYSGAYFFDGPTLGDDWAVFFAGTQRDTQADISSPRIYGSGNITTDITSGTATAIVDVKDATITDIFQAGDIVRVSDMVTIDSGTGTEELKEIDTIVDVTGSIVTMTFTTNLFNGYLATTPTKVSTVYEYGDVECSVDNWVETGSGTYDESTYPVVTNNLGTVEDTWTLTFSDSSNYTIVGLYSGSLGSHTTASDFEPTNSDWSAPYFKLEYLGFSTGDWVNGDTIVFQTHPASVPLWEMRVVPAGADPMSNNKIVKVTTGESA